MSEDQPLNQEDIDAALAGLGSEAEPPTEPPGSAADVSADGGAPETSGSAGEATSSEAIDQDDIDALLKDSAAVAEDGSASPEPSVDAAADGSASEASSSAGETTPSEDIDQDDIDALLNDATALAEASTEVPAEPSADTAASPTAPSEQVQLDSAGRPFDAAAAEMAAAIASEQASAPAPTPPAPPPPGAEAMQLPDLGSPGEQSDAWQAIELLKDVDLQVKIELGRSRMLVEDVLRLGEGSVVELDKLAGDPVDVYVNDRLVARGEVLVLNDNFCVRVNEIISDLSKEFQTA